VATEALVTHTENRLAQLGADLDGLEYIQEEAIEPSHAHYLFHGAMMNLTSLWNSVGGVNSQRPANWLQQDGTQLFVSKVAQTFNVAQDYILKTKKGRRSGGTWAHWQIGLSYAQYLDPELQMWVNQVAKERFEEMADPAQVIRR